MGGLVLVAALLGAVWGMSTSPGGTREARDEVRELLARARAIGAAARPSGGVGTPVVLVPGIGGTQLEQKFANAAGPHFFCKNNQVGRNWTAPRVVQNPLEPRCIFPRSLWKLFQSTNRFFFKASFLL